MNCQHHEVASAASVSLEMQWCFFSRMIRPESLCIYHADGFHRKANYADPLAANSMRDVRKSPLVLHCDGYKSFGNLIAAAISPLSLYAPGFFCHLVRLMETAI